MPAGQPAKFKDPVVLTFVCERELRDYINKHKIDRLAVFKRGMEHTVPDDMTAIQHEHSRIRTLYLKQKIDLDQIEVKMNALQKQLDTAEEKKGKINKLKYQLFDEWRKELQDPNRRPHWDYNDHEVHKWFDDRNCPISYGAVIQIWDEVVPKEKKDEEE